LNSGKVEVFLLHDCLFDSFDLSRVSLVGLLYCRELNDNNFSMSLPDLSNLKNLQTLYASQSSEVKKLRILLLSTSAELQGCRLLVSGQMSWGRLTVLFSSGI
jgi:hypothetical protein